MRKHPSGRPLFPAPSHDGEGDSYYEITRGLQESLLADVLRKTGRTEALPYELADATHVQAKRFQQEMGRHFQTDCKKKCAYCCYQPATVFPFEAIRIARFLADSLSDEELEVLKMRMKDRVSDFKGASVRKQVNNKTVCPFLLNDQCFVYEHRPLTCRMAHSFSVKQCRQSFQGDRARVQIPIALELLTGVSGMIEAAFEELPKNNLDGKLYELCSAVLAALSRPDAAVKWAKGDFGVFRDCIRDDT